MNTLNEFRSVRKLLVTIPVAVILGWGMIFMSVSALEEFLIVDKPLAHADALVVMAGSQSERLPAAAALYKKGVAHNIYLTNDGVSSAYSMEKQRNLYQVEWAEYELMAMQVPEKAIVKLSHTSSGSIYDALNSRKAILDKGAKSIVIVTSDYHTKRSLWAFERVFRNHAVAIGVCPAKSKIVALPCYQKLLPLSCELLKYCYYRCKYKNI